MEKKRMVISLVLIVWFLALIFTFYYLYNVYNDVTTPITIPSKIGNPEVELYAISPLSLDQLNVGTDVPVSKGDIIPVSVKGEDYSIKVFQINNSGADLSVNSFLYFSLKNNETKKLDFNGDNYYDLLITLKNVENEKATFFIKSINEKKDAADQLDEALTTIRQNSAIQTKLIVLIALVFIIILVIYFIKVYLAPAISLKKRTDREKPSSVMDYLFEEFNISRKAGNIKDARKILTKAKSLYKHMSEDDRKSFSSKMKFMEKYIN